MGYPLPPSPRQAVIPGKKQLKANKPVASRRTNSRDIDDTRRWLWAPPARYIKGIKVQVSLRGGPDVATCMVCG